MTTTPTHILISLLLIIVLVTLNHNHSFMQVHASFMQVHALPNNPLGKWVALRRLSITGQD